MTTQMVLCPLIGSGEGAQAKILRFEQAPPAGGDLVHRVSAGAGDVVAVMAPGIYSVSATMRFQCMAAGDDPAPWSNGWGITLNTQQRPTDWFNNFPKYALAWALLPEPNERERQREPMTTLSWVGLLAPGDELRIESERPNPRLYQGVTADRLSFVRISKLLVTVA